MISLLGRFQVVHKAKYLVINVGFVYKIPGRETQELETIQAGLRMNAFSTHGGVDEVRFEMMCLSAAIIGQCHKCISSHVAQMRKGGYTTEQIRDVGRIAATLAGVATVLDTMINS